MKHHNPCDVNSNVCNVLTPWMRRRVCMLSFCRHWTDSWRAIYWTDSKLNSSSSLCILSPMWYPSWEVCR